MITVEVAMTAFAAMLIAVTLAFWAEHEPNWCNRVQRFCAGDLQTERESDLCMYIDQDSQLDCKTGYHLLTEDQGR